MQAKLALALLLQIHPILGAFQCPQAGSPQRVLTILGGTGVGKSSIANVLMGENEDCDACIFRACPGTDSCTKEAQYTCGPWLGKPSNRNFVVVDTPGFGDSDSDMASLLQDTIRVLKQNVSMTHMFLLAFDGTNPRLTSGLQQMLHQLESVFGTAFWDNAELLITKWSMDQHSLKMRIRSGQDKAWLTRSMNKALQAKTHLDRNLTAFFIDSWARMPDNIDDPVQQASFDAETERLWQTSMAFDAFKFHAVEDVRNELEECKKTLGDDIAKLQAEVKKLQEGQTNHTQDIKQLAIDVGDTKVEIDTLETDTSKLSLAVRNHTSAIEFNAKLIDNLHLAPIGAIVGWTPRPAVDKANIDLPHGWVRCDGQVIPAPSTWAGTKTPDLNSERRFLRGGDDAHSLVFEDDTVQDHKHASLGHKHTDSGHSHNVWPKFYMVHHPGGKTKTAAKLQVGNNYAFTYTAENTEPGKANIQTGQANIGNPTSGRHGDETRPKNMGVVWIMRVF